MQITPNLGFKGITAYSGSLRKRDKACDNDAKALTGICDLKKLSLTDGSNLTYLVYGEKDCNKIPEMNNLPRISHQTSVERDEAIYYLRNNITQIKRV